MIALVFILSGALCGPTSQAPGLRTAGAGAMTLRAAIAEALAASPALQPARDAVEMAAIQERHARSRFGLQLSPALELATLPNGLRQQQAGLTASRRLPTGTQLTIGADWLRFGSHESGQQDAGMSFTISQSLLQVFGPVPRAGLTSASRASASAALSLNEARQQLVIRAAGAYFAIVRQELLVEAATQARVRAARLREASEARARVGLATELDVMRAELLAAQAEASLAAERESLDRARDAFNALLGRPIDSPVDVELTAVPDAVAADLPDLAALQASALARRGDVLEARARIADAERHEAVARWSALPDIQVTAGYARRGLAGGPSIFNDWLGGWRAGISTTYGLQRSDAAAASAAAALTTRAAEREAFDREQAAAVDVRAAHRAVVRTAGAIEIQRKAMAVAERQARLATLRYERGLADNVDVIDAEMNMLQARTALIGARVDHALARMTLERASGQLDPDGYLK